MGMGLGVDARFVMGFVCGCVGFWKVALRIILVGFEAVGSGIVDAILMIWRFPRVVCNTSSSCCYGLLLDFKKLKIHHNMCVVCCVCIMLGGGGGELVQVVVSTSD